MTASTRNRSLVVDISDEDERFARQQNRYNCVIVRAIQRALPDALRVTADTKEIAFSLPQDDTRYYFQTPPEVVKNVIEPFDKRQPIIDRTFILASPCAAEPMIHRNREAMIAQRDAKRTRAPRPRTTSVPLHKLNRFLDYVADDATTESENAGRDGYQMKAEGE